MNDKTHLKTTLDSIAHDEVPETTNLWPQVAAHMKQKDSMKMNPTYQPARRIALMLLVLLAATAACALYRFVFMDPGLQAVSDAGKFVDINATVQSPIGQPPIIPLATGEATQLAASQGQLTATLVSAYADVNRMAFKVHFDGWKEDFSISPPRIQDENGTDIGGNATWNNGSDATISVENINVLQSAQFKGKLLLMVMIDSPDGDQDSLTSPQPARFEFSLNLPVQQMRTFEPKQTVIAHGVELILEKIEMSPSFTKCYFSINSNGKLSGIWSVAPIEARLNPQDEPLASFSPYFVMGPDEDTIITKGESANNVAKFALGYENHSKTITLNIPGFKTDQPVAAETLKAASEKLKSQGIEVQFEGDDWRSNFTIIKKPGSMSDQDIWLLFNEAAGTYYPGPWVFTVAIQ